MDAPPVALRVHALLCLDYIQQLRLSGVEMRHMHD